jgi:hypothetical protein
MVKIRSEKLTTCRVAADGAEVGLEFLDASGAAVRLEMPVEQAESLIMTLPQLLACALRQRTGDQDARYVFGLGEWAIESAKGQDCLIATLKTPDGFEVCFGIPFEACPLAWLESAARGRDARSRRTIGGAVPADFELKVRAVLCCTEQNEGEQRQVRPGF